MRGLVNASKSSAGRFRLLPGLMAVIAVAILVKAGSFAADVSQFTASAMAQEAEAESDAPDEDAGPEAPASPSDEPETPPAAGSEALEDFAAVSGISGSERALLEDLRKRRRELEKREQDAALREQLLASTERRIDEKIAQLQTLESRIEALVETHKDQENEQLASIVKVYESMKPKDAAPIFQRLDLDIQMQVATRMKDRSMAALLSEMNPDAAKTLTTRLATRTELPDAAELLDANPETSGE